MRKRATRTHMVITTAFLIAAGYILVKFAFAFFLPH
jgi:hypothetical protein